MKFALWLDQGDRGCDYTIACGKTLIELKAQTVEAAHEEAKGVLYELTHVSLSENETTPNGDSRIFKQALLVIIGGDLTNLASLAGEIRLKEKLAERTATKREQLERLKKELGET